MKKGIRAIGALAIFALGALIVVFFVTSTYAVSKKPREVKHDKGWKHPVKPCPACGAGETPPAPPPTTTPPGGGGGAYYNYEWMNNTYNYGVNPSASIVLSPTQMLPYDVQRFSNGEFGVVTPAGGLENYFRYRPDGTLVYGNKNLFYNRSNIAEAADGSLVSVDASHKKLVKVDANGAMSDLYGGAIDLQTIVQMPNGNIAALRVDGAIIEISSQTGAVISTLFSSSPDFRHMSFMPDGTVYGVCEGTGAVYKGSPGGAITQIATLATGVGGDQGIVALPNGDIIVLNNTANQLVRYGSDGTLKGVVATVPGTNMHSIKISPNGKLYTTVQPVSGNRVVYEISFPEK